MRPSSVLFYYRGLATKSPPLVQIENATFYRQHPTGIKVGNPPLFENLTFNLPCDIINRRKPELWAIVGASNSGKTTLLEILNGRHLCLPPTARSFPHLATIGHREVRLWDKRDLRLRNPVNAIQYVGFGGKADELGQGDTRGAYLAARYESRKEITDFSLDDYLKGNTDLNPADEYLNDYQIARDKTYFDKAVKIMKLQDLLDLPVNTLSNGQTRRARIAKALIKKPRLLLLDEPFLGIDPLSNRTMSPLLFLMSRRSGPQIILTLQPHDEIPKWVTHVMYLGTGCTIKYKGSKESVVTAALNSGDPINLGNQKWSMWRKYRPAVEQGVEEATDSNALEYGRENPTGDHKVSPSNCTLPNINNRWDVNYDIPGASSGSLLEPLIEMKGVKVNYGDRTVLGNWQQNDEGKVRDGLWWKVNRGERWAVLGPNGSGKTTVLSLICSDHPQSYSLPINFWGRTRLPSTNQTGISVFDIQARIGQSSPEIHGFFPRHLTVRQTIENSWADTFLSKPHLTFERDVTVDNILRWFSSELNPNHRGADPIDGLAELRSDVDHPADYSRTSRSFEEYMSLDIDWADSISFRDLSFSSQRVLLLLRAIAKRPDLVILDEAFSGLDERTRIKCMMFLAYGETKWLQYQEGRDLARRPKMRTVLDKRAVVKFPGFEARQALLVVSHRKEEVPGLVNQWMCLPEPNSGHAVRFGEITYAMRGGSQLAPSTDWWERVWGPRLKTALKQPERRIYRYDKE